MCNVNYALQGVTRKKISCVTVRILNFSPWSLMRAECYLTSNGCFTRADQSRSINNRRSVQKKEKGKKNRKLRFRGGTRRVYAHEFGATPSGGAGCTEGRVRSPSPWIFKAARERRDRNSAYFTANCIARCPNERASAFPLSYFQSRLQRSLSCNQ